MRDIWDGKKMRAAKKQKGPAFFSRTGRSSGKHAKEGLALQNFFTKNFTKNLMGQAKTQKYFLEHLELKRAVMDFFPDYQGYLGEGGFTKI